MLAPITAALLSAFIGVAPASGLSCVRPEESVARAVKSSSETFFTGDDVVTGKRYHVIMENKSANPCGVFDAEEFPHLTDGIGPVDAFGIDAHRAADPSGPVDNNGENARWLVASVGAAGLLSAATLVAFLVARRRRSTRHPALGALIGLDVGAALAGWLFLLPRLRDGDFYEVTDTLIFGALPLLIVGSAIGAIVGAFAHRGDADTNSWQTGRSAAVVAASLAVCLLGTWLWLWGTGVVNFP